MTIKINGGIVSSQALTGSLKYFKMTGNFDYTVSDGTVTLAGANSGGNPPNTTYPLVAQGDPVPNSLASLALNAIASKCTIVEIGFTGDSSTTVIDFSTENTSFGWLKDDGTVDLAAMEAAVAAVEHPAGSGTVIVPTTSGGPVDDTSSAPVYVPVSTAVTIEQVAFKLAV